MNNKQIATMTAAVEASVLGATTSREATKEVTAELAKLTAPAALTICGTIINGLGVFSAMPKVQKSKKQVACRMVAGCLKRAFSATYNNKVLTFSTTGELTVKDAKVTSAIDKLLDQAEKIGFTTHDLGELEKTAVAVEKAQATATARAEKTAKEATAKLEDVYTTIAAAMPETLTKKTQLKAIRATMGLNN